VSEKFDAHWLSEYERRNAPKIRNQVESEDAYEGLEGELHKEIIAELRRRRWYFVRSRTDKKTTTRKGVTDFIIAMPDGKTLWLEVKKKGGKLDTDQTITRHVLLALSHRHEVAFSYQDFINAIDGISNQHKDSVSMNFEVKHGGNLEMPKQCCGCHKIWPPPALLKGNECPDCGGQCGGLR
jgi:rRNA maturation endonuclease Nob1